MKKHFKVVKSTAIFTIILLYLSVVGNFVLYIKTIDLNDDNNKIMSKLETLDKNNNESVDTLNDKISTLENQNKELKKENSDLDNIITKYQRRYGKVYR